MEVKLNYDMWLSPNIQPSLVVNILSEQLGFRVIRMESCPIADRIFFTVDDISNENIAKLPEYITVCSKN